MVKERINIFIDGGNFYHLVLKKLNTTELSFDFDKFANFIANDREIVIDDRVVDYKKLLEKGIRKIKKLLEKGIRKIKHEKLREKGIDVKLATDLIVGAIDNKYDTAVIVSSDTDLVPAIDWIRNRMKKRVEYVGFSIPDEIDPSKSTNPSLSLIAKTDIQRTLIVSDIKPFIQATLFK